MTLADDIGAFADGQRLPDVMVGDQHAKTTVAQMLDDAFDINNGNGVNPGKRLIQQNEFRISGQRAGDFNAAAFTAGQRLTEAVAQMLDVKFFHQLFRAVFTLLAAEIVTNLQHRH